MNAHQPSHVSSSTQPSAEVAVSIEKPPGQVRPGWELPLILSSPITSTTPQPVTVGLPFPKDFLFDPVTVALFGPDGRPVSLQTDPLANWSGGSIKWLLLDFIADSITAKDVEWTLRQINGGRAGGSSRPLQVHESHGRLTVETGVATLFVDPKSFPPLERVEAGNMVISARGSARALLTDLGGRVSTPRVDRTTIEARGPVRATVLQEGTFRGRVPCRFTARCCFFAGTALVRIRLTIRNPNRARHPGGLWDLGDPGSMLFRDLSLVFGLGRMCSPRITCVAEPGHPPCSADGGRLEIYQDSSGGENWRSRNHVNRHGQVPCSFRGYRIRGAGVEASGLRANPVVTLEGPEGSLAAAVAEFWQQFPKAIEVEGGALHLRLFPGQFGDFHELQGGEQKTHAIWLDLAPTNQAGEPLDWVHRPLRAHATPAWYAASGAIPWFTTAARTLDDRHEALMAEAIRGPYNLLARREVIDEYDWRHYGDVYADHEALHFRGETPIISHYNNQYDVIFGGILQYLRTGDSRWADLFEPLVRHVIDIDIYHTDHDRADYSGGLFWHTDHFVGAATCTHRCYSRANRPKDGRPYGGGPSAQHNYTTGLLHAYYLTGDPAALDATIGLADWVMRMDGGDYGYQGVPCRGSGNSLNAVLDGWLASGRRAYLDYAESLIRRSIHPVDDIPALNLLKDHHWSYTIFLSASARYLRVKAEAGELDRMYSYARACLLHYAAWMVEHERPEQYKSPTSSSSSLRKANVLRLAAEHADELTRARLLRCAGELADSAWHNVMRFASRSQARPVAIMMLEGTRDAYFRAYPQARAPQAVGHWDFGPRGRFVKKARRILALLRKCRVLARDLARRLNAGTWQGWQP